MYRFTNKDDFLELNIGDDEGSILSSKDGTSISIMFSINGFSGRGEVYSLSEELESFANNLLELERSRKGNVKLLTSGGDIFFEIKSIDLIGHFGIICNVSEYGFLGDEYRKYESTAFMEIDPFQLAEFANDYWVKVYKTSDETLN